MANQITSLTYGGYQYEVGNTVRVSNNIMYTTITRPSGNTIHMLSQCVMQITEIWEGTSAGSPVINPIRLKWVSGPSGSVNGGGFIRPEQIVPGSGGTPLSHTVTYEANGGAGAPEPQTKVWGSILTLSSQIPHLEGHDFVIWNTRPDRSGTSYNPGDLYGYDEDMTLYAIWRVQTSTVTYDANGGVGAPDPQTKYWGSILTLSSQIPTRKGYQFLHWNTERNGSGENFAPGGLWGADVDRTLYAQWKMTTTLYEREDGRWVPKTPYFCKDGKWHKANAYEYHKGAWRRGNGG